MVREGEGADYLAASPAVRSQKFMRGLRLLAQRKGFEWVCIWIRAISDHRGDHTHLYLHWPRRNWRALIDLLVDVTGVWPEAGALPFSVITQAEGGAGWDIRENVRGIEGAVFYAGYLGAQHDKRGHRAPPDRKASGISANINLTARRRAEFSITADAT